MDTESSTEHQYIPSGAVPVVLLSLTTIGPLFLVNPGTSVPSTLAPDGANQFPEVGVPGRLVIHSREVSSVEPISLIST